jgi:hypothetical protein
MTDYGYVKRQREGHNADTYHTDPTCCNAPEDPRRVPIDRIERSPLSLCAFCAGDVTQTSDRRPSLREQIQRGEIDV